jgi:hypothetical protein
MLLPLGSLGRKRVGFVYSIRGFRSDRTFLGGRCLNLAGIKEVGKNNELLLARSGG